MKKQLLVCAIICAGFITSASAQTTTPTTAKAVTQKNYHEKSRIKEGVKSGELTKPEAHKLVKDEKGIHKDVKSAKADGVVTKEERKDIRQDKRQQSRRTYRLKHNGRVKG